MVLGRGKRVFVGIAVPILVLAAQVQSCSASGGGAGGSAGSGATGGGAPYDGGGSPPNPLETRVAIVQSPVPTAGAIDQTEVTRLVTEAVNLAGGLAGIVSDGMTVVVKPNLVAGTDFTGPNYTGQPLAPTVNGVTTDYRVTAAVVALVRQLNPSGIVYVMEGSAYPTAPIMQALGYTAAYIPGVTEFVAIETDSALPGGMVGVAPAAGSILGQTLYYNTRYLNANVVISVGTLKTHWNAVVTGSIKNLGIGATPANYYGNPTSTANPVTRQGGPSSIDHASVFLHHWIADYYAARPAQFVVIDGLQGIQNGPTPARDVSGTTNLATDQMNMRLIMAGRDAVAVDTVESLVMGWDPTSVTYLTDLFARGVGTMETANIRVLGSRVDQVRRPFAGPLTLQSYGGAQVTDLTPPPVVVNGAGVIDGRLSVLLGENPDLHKVEVYLNGVILEPTVTSGFANISLDVRHLAPGTYDLDVLGYDTSLNSSLFSWPGAVTIQ
jgi:uncharacterized protein (DUF362 family)